MRYLTALLKVIEQAEAEKGEEQLAVEADEWVEAMDIRGAPCALRAKTVE